MEGEAGDNQDVVEDVGGLDVVVTAGVVVGSTSEGVTGDGLGALDGSTKVVVLDDLDRDTGFAGAGGGPMDQCHTAKIDVTLDLHVL